MFMNRQGQLDNENFRYLEVITNKLKFSLFVVYG